jgi:hypothetical protein
MTEQREFLRSVIGRIVVHETKLYKEQDQDVVLVLTGVHSAAKLIATGPERRVKFRFLEGHWLEEIFYCMQIRGSDDY